MDFFKNWAKDWVARGDFLQAARNIVISQVNPKRPINVWSWWKRNFGKRADYSDMTARFVEAIFEEYHTGGELYRETTAAIFGKRKSAAKLPVERLIESIRRNNKYKLPLPEHFSPQPPRPKHDEKTSFFRYPALSIKRPTPTLVDLRKDFRELKRLLKKLVDLRISKTKKAPQPVPISAIAIGFYLCQRGWILIHFDERPAHQRDGDWARPWPGETVKVPQWKKDHNALQARGGKVILPDGRTLNVRSCVSCEKLAAIYGGMIRAAVLESKKAGVFKNLTKTKGCQFDIEEFDGMWVWPNFEKLGKTNRL